MSAGTLSVYKGLQFKMLLFGGFGYIAYTCMLSLNIKYGD